MEIKVAFYKGKGSWYSKLIRWWTKGRYSHTEIIIDGYQYSSVEGIGVRKKKHHYDEREWDYVDIYNIDSRIIKEFYKLTFSSKYDKIGILGFLVPFKDRSDEWFCSEWCSNALKISGYKAMWDKEPNKINPNRLYRIVNGI